MKPDDQIAAEAAAAKAEEEAKAAAEAEAAKAKAEAITPDPKPKRAKKAKAAIAPADDLRRAITTIEKNNNPHHRAALIEVMVEEGAKVTEDDASTSIDWLGVSVLVPAGKDTALTTWCSKARRKILSGEAV